MRRIDIALPWAGVSAAMMFIGDRMADTNSRLTPAMRRVHQSRSARALAIDLLRERGVEVNVIGKGPVGEPMWPEHVSGSLAHSGDCVVAVVADAGTTAGIGVDIAAAEALPADTDDMVLVAEERKWADSVRAREAAAGRLVFCAKECVHKAIYPLSKRWLEFSDVRVDFDDQIQTFRPQPLSEAALSLFSPYEVDGVVLRQQAQLILVLRLAAREPSA